MKQQKIKMLVKTFIIGLCIILMFLIIFAIITKMQNIRYSKILNNKINQFIEKIKEEYPEVKDEDIIKILKSENKTKKEFLEEYNFDKELSAIKIIKDEMSKDFIINLVIIFCFGMCFISIIIVYILKQEKKIKNINEYIQEVNTGNYILNIEDNDEGELSKLKNELYKTSVLLKEAAENSKQENINLSNSLADISHQIKTPLTSIRIMLDNIEENPNMDQKIREDFIREISKQIDWISSLVISLLKISKFDAGVIKMNYTQINVKEFIENIIGNLSIFIETKEIDIITNIPENSVFEADYKWQQEAITNILKNAIEHSNEKSKIYITVENNSLFLKIKIKDEGEGIDKKDLKHIFERFYRAKNSSENNIGIGLSLAKIIIEKNNGNITVDSELGKGTTFELKYLKNMMA